MARKAKYVVGTVINNFELLERSGGTNPKGKFRNVFNGELSEHYIADVVQRRVVARRAETHTRANYQPGDRVGDNGAILIRKTENGYAVFNWDGVEVEQQLSKVATNDIRGYRVPAKQFKVGEQVGVYGLVLASEPKNGKAKFRYPSGHHKVHRVADVDRGIVTGEQRGRPLSESARAERDRKARLKQLENEWRRKRGYV